MRISRQIGWSQEANLIYELIQQTERLNQILPGNQAAVRTGISKQIGWSTEANLYYEWLRSLNKLTTHFGCPDCVPTTTTTTTAAPVDSTLEVTVGVSAPLFDITSNSSFGCWIKMESDTNFPRIFSFGQYPTAEEAISIEGGTLYFWYNGGIAMSYPLTSYIGNWMWIAITNVGGTIVLWIDGNPVTSAAIPSVLMSSPVMYIGSENAPDTYYRGLMAGFIFDLIDTSTPPTAPFVPGSSTFFLIGQGNDLTSQITNQGIISLPIVNSNCTYSTDSPYGPGYGGSLKFG